MEPKAHYRSYKRPPTVLILSYPVYTFQFQFLKIHFTHNINLPSMPRYSKCSPSIRSPHQNFVCTSNLPHKCHKHRPPLSSWFYQTNSILMFIGPCIIVIFEEWKTNLLSLAILFQLLCAQHVSDINISIFRSLRLCWWITTSVVLFSVRCVLELWCGWF